MTNEPNGQLPPTTGLEIIDRALLELDLSGPVVGHHERLSQVHDVLAKVLNPASPTGS